MNWSPELIALRNALMVLYPTVEDARLLVEEAGLESGYIEFGGKAIQNWRNILTESERSRQTEALLSKAQQRFHNNSDLAAVVGAYRAWAAQRPTEGLAGTQKSGGAREKGQPSTPGPGISVGGSVSHSQFLVGNYSIMIGNGSMNSGLMHVPDPSQPRLEELRREVAVLRAQLEIAIEAGAIPERSTAKDIEGDVAAAQEELEEEEPDGQRVLRKLQGATDLILKTNELSEAAGTLASKLASVVPHATLLLQLVRSFFGV